MKTFDELTFEEKAHALHLFDQLLQNEQQKAIQAVTAYNSGAHFGGTSVTALVAKPELTESLQLNGLEELAARIADNYLKEVEKIKPLLMLGFSAEECDLFNEHGLFYAVHISPKLIALSEGLVVEHKDLILPGFPEPYALPKHPDRINDYFAELHKQRGLDLDLSSLILADTTTPVGYEGKKILNPNRLNEKLSQLSALVTEALKAKGSNVDPLCVISSDTDSPHRLLICEGRKPIEGYPLTPGATLCGSTAAMGDFDFLYVYRISLISQMLSGNIISSRIAGKFSPFTFFSILSPFGYKNGAINPGKMGDLRYESNIDLRKEFLHQYEGKVKQLL